MTRIAFLGTPASAVPTLEGLVRAGHDVSMVVSRPDRRRGRGGATSPSPVKDAALRLGLRVTSRLGDLEGAEADLGVVVAYGRIIPSALLDRMPMVNVHFSLLPRWRGAAPVERAILAGDPMTGVCLMQLDEGIDTGPVYSCREVSIGSNETAAELCTRLSELGAEMAVRLLESVKAAGPAALPRSAPQSGEASYAAKIDPGELELRWSEPAVHLDRVVRVGRAYTSFRNRRLLVLRAEVVPGSDVVRANHEPGSIAGPVVTAGEGYLRLVEVQPEGARSMPAEDWLRGARPVKGERLGV